MKIIAILLGAEALVFVGRIGARYGIGIGARYGVTE